MLVLDMVSMARPFLADPEFVIKAKCGREDEINTCIACNQACLDHVFQAKRATCLVNPRAGYETELKIEPTNIVNNIAVVGAGPGGLAFATYAAMRGHRITLFDQQTEIGGQFNMAKIIPGKEDFHETIRYFKKQLELNGVNLQLGKQIFSDDLLNFDQIVLATGVKPRSLRIPGIEHEKVVSYVDVLQKKSSVGNRVAIIGAGGIGFDVAEFVTHNGVSASLDLSVFANEWGIDTTNENRGGITSAKSHQVPVQRQVYLLQRKSSKHGKDLGKTTGWIHRLSLKHRNVHMVGGITYDAIDDTGLHYTDKEGKKHLLDVDTIIICAGQESRLDLQAPLLAQGKKVYCIGGADKAVELDAKRAIGQGARLAFKIETASPGESVFEAPGLYERILDTTRAYMKV